MNTNDSKQAGKLILYGHPFSSYTWKVLIALYADETPFEFRIVDNDHPEHIAAVQAAGPLGKFPVLEEKGNILFEATTILEYLASHHPGQQFIMPTDPNAAIGMRMLDRVFDNYVMGPMQDIVDEHLRNSEKPDQTRIAEARAKLDKSYAWIDGWLEYYPPVDYITLIECAAAPALFYADWVHPIADDFARLQIWRSHLLRLPPVAKCIEEARPYREFFPLGDPGRD